MIIPGLPPLPSYVNILGSIEALASDTIFSGTNQWGLFLDGEPAVVANSVVAFEFKEEWRISKHPLEEGAFASYNKVQVPFDVMFQFATGGLESDRTALLESVSAIIGSLDLFDAITPETTYSSVNPTRWDYRRKATEGAGLLIIDLYCELVNVTSQAQFSNTQSPSAQATDQSGTVQTTDGTATGGNGVATSGGRIIITPLKFTP